MGNRRENIIIYVRNGLDEGLSNEWQLCQYVCFCLPNGQLKTAYEPTFASTYVACLLNKSMSRHWITQTKCSPNNPANAIGFILKLYVNSYTHFGWRRFPCQPQTLFTSTPVIMVLVMAWNIQQTTSRIWNSIHKYTNNIHYAQAKFSVSWKVCSLFPSFWLWIYAKSSYISRETHRVLS